MLRLTVGVLVFLWVVCSAHAQGPGNASTGPNGLNAPAASTQIGSVDGSGHLQPASTTNPMPVVSVPKVGSSNLSVSVFGTAASTTVKSSAGFLFGIYCTNRNTSDRYIQIFAANGSTSGTPLFSFRVPGLGLIVVGNDFFSTNGIPVSTGITAGVSTTNATYTGATASDLDYTVVYQ